MMSKAGYSDNSPSTLQELSVRYLIGNLETFCDYDRDAELYSLKPDVALPAEICDMLFSTFVEEGHTLDDKLIHIFSDPLRSRLKRMNLRDSLVSDVGLGWLMPHAPMDLDISNCSDLSKESIQHINRYGHGLRKLFIGNSVRIFRELDLVSTRSAVGSESTDEEEGIPFIDEEMDAVIVRNRTHKQNNNFANSQTPMSTNASIFSCPNLKAFSVHSLYETEYPAHDIMENILVPLKGLSYLDLSGCEIELEFLDCLERLSLLTTLILYDVPINNVSGAFHIIAKLKNLRALDLSQSKDMAVVYSEPEKNLGYLVSSLPKLRSLDISGTNLAGFDKPEPMSHRPDSNSESAKLKQAKEKRCCIPALHGRQLDFLGLLDCSYEACHRENIPAIRVTGDANEEQVILAAQTYVEKAELLIKALNLLFHTFRYSTFKNQRAALQAILAAMRRHPCDKHIQISGSASLFYIVKGEEKHQLGWKTKKKKVPTATLR